MTAITFSRDRDLTRGATVIVTQSVQPTLMNKLDDDFTRRVVYTPMIVMPTR